MILAKPIQITQQVAQEFERILNKLPNNEELATFSNKLS